MYYEWASLYYHQHQLRHKFFYVQLRWRRSEEMKKRCHRVGCNIKRHPQVYFVAQVQETCTIRLVSSLNVNISLAWKRLAFLLLSSFSLQFPLISESLCLPRTLALSGNDVNGVKMLSGSRGRKTQSDFGEWVTSVEKCGEENTLMLFIFLQRLFLSITHMCVAPKSVVRLCIHLVQYVFVVFSTLEAAVVFFLASSLFHFLLSSHRAALSFSHCYLPVWESSQDFRSAPWVWNYLEEEGHWLGPFLFLTSTFLIN